MNLSSLVIPVLLAGVALYGMGKRVDVYGALTHGAEEGLTVLLKVLPALVGLLTAVAMFRASGALEWLTGLCAPALEFLGIPPETTPLMLVRPVSGSGALAVGSDLIATYGPDSYIGRVAAVMLGSTETTFYTIAVYFLDETGGLTPVEMTLDLYEGDTQAGAVVKALLEGTEEKDWLSAIPEGFQVTSVRLEESTCYVDLPTAALPGLPEGADLSLALRALADSLLSLRAVEEVRYLVDGEFASAYGGAAVLEPYLSAA